MAVRLIAGGLLASFVAGAWPAAAQTGDNVADWRKRTGVYRFGMIAPAGAAARVGLDAFASHLSGRLGMPAEAFVFPDAASLIDALISGRLEHAALPALGFAAAEVRCQCLIPVAAPLADNGANGIRGVLLANSDRVKGFSDLAGRPIGIGPDGSMTGDVIPSVAFRFLGKPLSDAGFDLRKSETVEAAIAAFVDGKIEALYTWEYEGGDAVAARAQSVAGRISALPGSPPVTVLWRSDVIPFGPHAVRADMPVAIRTLLATTLEALPDDSPEAFDAVSPSLGGGMRAVNAGDYAFVVTLAQALAARRLTR